MTDVLPASAPGSVAVLLVWLLAIVGSTWLVVYLTSGRRRLGRPTTSVAVTILAVTLTAGYLAWAGIDGLALLAQQARTGLPWAIVIGGIAGIQG
ncbi:MAG: hypothetical protein ACXWQ6_02055 [Candidatus Limnocylindrales bacterium]